MNELTAFQRESLFAIAGSDEPSGLEIKSDLEEVYENINHGRLYPNLDELVEMGLVEKGEKDKRTNSYQITSEGMDMIENHIGRIEETVGFDDTSSEAPPA